MLSGKPLGFKHGQLSPRLGFFLSLCVFVPFAVCLVRVARSVLSGI